MVKVPLPDGAVITKLLKSARSRTSAFPFLGSVLAPSFAQAPAASVSAMASTSALTAARETWAGEEIASAGFIGWPCTVPLNVAPAGLLPLPHPTAAAANRPRSRLMERSHTRGGPRAQTGPADREVDHLRLQ